MPVLFAAVVAAALPLVAPSPAPTPAPSPYPLETILAQRVTAGGVALLVSHVADPRAARLVTEALAHEDAVVREAAARVAAATGLASAGPAVWTAVATEKDRRAAGEMIHAAVALTPPGRDHELLPIAARHDVVFLLADAVASARGPRAITMLDRLLEAGALDAPQFLVVATRWGREGLAAAAAHALRKRDETHWATVLMLARQPDAALPPGLLIASLGSPDAAIRAATYWHLAVTLAKDKAVAPEIEAAIAATAEAAARPDADVGAAFALTVLRRAQKGKRHGGDWPERAAAGRPRIPRDLDGRPLRIAGLLTKAEARALSREMTSGETDDWLSYQEMVRNDAPLLVRRRTIAGGVTGPLLREVMRATGCQPKDGMWAAAAVEYEPDGRPRRLGIAQLPDGRPCAQAAIPLLALARPFKATVASATRSSLLVAMGPEAVACAEEWVPAPIRPLGTVPDGRPTAPKRTREADPKIPVRAVGEGVSGVVHLNGVISNTGCMLSVEVVRNARADLDAWALSTVEQWRYEPMVIDGKPVAVSIAVTMSLRVD
jgi:TonB family protein